MKKSKFIPLSGYHKYTESEMIERSEGFMKELKRRRTVRSFSSEKAHHKIIENCLQAAGTAPSGANIQPWHFVVVSDPQIKRKIRELAEEEEREFYEKRAPKEWLEALAHLGTDEHKPFLETAPHLIVIFEKKYDLLPDGKKVKHYYTKESVGIACGMLITAIHHAGLVSLTHTPSPMNFLNKILNRPANEKPFLILVVGYPSVNTEVPDISRKPLDEIATFI